MLKEKLEKIGLTKGESEIYELLIELGPSKAGELIKKANIVSSKVYVVLQRLVNKGLVSIITKGGIKTYQATSPERFVDFLDEKSEDLEKAKKEVLNLILRIKSKDPEEKNEVRMFLGNKGPKIVISELIEEARKSGRINYGYGTHDNKGYKELFPSDLNKFFEAEKKYKLKTKLLFSKGHKKKQPKAKIKYLDPKLISSVRTMIAGNKVFLVDFTKPFTSIIIENRQIAESYKKHFEILWKIAKK